MIFELKLKHMLSILSGLSFWRRTALLGLLAVALWFGTAVYAPVTWAADTPEAEAYENGPVRPSYNPLSNENFQGGVDAETAAKATADGPDSQAGKGLVDSVKDFFSDQPQSDALTDKQVEENPTLKRYNTGPQ